jgi:N-acetylneuraminic acid mutarotase
LAIVGIYIVVTLNPGEDNEPDFNGFPIAPQRWEPLSDLPSARSDLTVVTVEDDLFAVGGRTQNQASGNFERYDPETDTWYGLVNKPTPVFGAKAAVLGGLIYLPGGETSPGEPTNVVEVYDTREQVWSTVTPLPVDLSRYAMVAYEGKLYVIGGWDGSIYKNSVYSYNPQTNIWEEHSPMPTARGNAGAAVAGGAIYVIGGFDGENAVSVNESFRPNDETGATQAWNVQAPLPSPRYAMGTVAIAEIIYIVGGEGGENLTEILEYFPLSDEWRSEGIQLELPWSRMGLATLGTDLYAIGGMTEDKPSSSAMRFKAIYVINLPLVQ